MASASELKNLFKICGHDDWDYEWDDGDRYDEIPEEVRQAVWGG